MRPHVAPKATSPRRYAGRVVLTGRFSYGGRILVLNASRGLCLTIAPFFRNYSPLFSVPDISYLAVTHLNVLAVFGVSRRRAP